MIPVIVRSTDAGAPALSGTAGAMIGVLDFCLVTKLGWAKAFTGTNLASYRPPATAPIRHYLDIIDTGTTTFTMRGYETMTAVGTGTGPFPSVAQFAAPGPPFNKSSTADAVARPWICFGDDRTFYFIAAHNVATTPWPPAAPFWRIGFGFGEYVSVLAGDNYRTFLSRGLVASPTGLAGTNSATAAGWVWWGPRNYVGASAASVFLGTGQSGSLSGSSISGENLGGQIPFPNPADGGLYLSRIAIAEFGNGATPIIAGNAPPVTIRGRLRGLNQVGHPLTAFTEGDTFDGIGEFAGRTFYITKLNPSGSAGPYGVAALETTAWDVSS